MNQSQLAIQQQQLAPLVELPPDNQGYQPQADHLIFSLDIQYMGNQAYIALDIQRGSGEIVGVYVGFMTVTVPYVPQFFCFREGPPLLAIVERVQQQFNLQPNLLIVDGHGLAHPRRFGAACWLGVKTDLPTIGCAKQTLMPYTGEVDPHRGSCLFIEDTQGVIGAVLVTQNGVKPIFVSVGHKISLLTARQVVLKLASTYRQCEPLRRADQAARAYAQGMLAAQVVDLGPL